MPNLNPTRLPETIQVFVRLIGRAKTIRLVETFGGTTFPVPVGGKRELGLLRRAILAEIIGEDEAQKIINHFGGAALYIPRCAHNLRAERDTAIINDFEQLSREGYSGNEACNELAVKYRLSNRRIWDILNQPQAEISDPQQCLFQTSNPRHN